MRNDIDFYRRSPGWLTDPFGTSRRMNNFFDNFMNWDRDVIGGGTEDRYYPPLDMDETDDHYYVSMDLPGVSKENIRIEAQGNQITVSGERRYERSEGRTGATQGERRHGRFFRAVTLPADIDTENIEATCHDGVLELSIPKSASQRPRRITIGEGKGFFARLKDRVEEAIGGEEESETGRRREAAIPVREVNASTAPGATKSQRKTGTSGAEDTSRRGGSRVDPAA